MKANTGAALLVWFAGDALPFGKRDLIAQRITKRDKDGWKGGVAGSSMLGEDR
ncbi:MAG: hypothetical protein AAF919_02760 [Pseudomonadota bacterium]